MELSGAEIVVQSLIEEDVEHLFGYPGGAVLHIYDALYKQDQLQHILVRHEQAATHAADGYARSTGKPGVVLVTSGPGATNAVTGIATAYMDSIPMVVLTGQVPLPLIGNDAFQEVDSVGITRPVVKHNFLVKDVKDIASTIKKAFYVATTGRPGPVVVDIPKDITAPDRMAEFSYPREISVRSYNPVTGVDAAQLKRAYELIMTAQKPMIYTGGGVVLSNASDQLVKFTHLLGAPITNTLMGLSAYPASDRQFLGMLGMHGTYEANMGMHHCDVLIAIGARFDDRVTGNLEKFCPDARIVHVDIDPASISKNVKVDVAVVGDVKEVVGALNGLIEASEKRLEANALSSWWQQIEEWRAQDCLKYNRSSEGIKPQNVVEQLHEVTKGNAFVTSDVGQHQMFAAQYYGFNKPRRWINSGGLGTMGFGLPAAMGVQLAHPGEQVACITGEGSIQMCIQELSTCQQYGLPVKIINLNNGFLGMVRQWQEFFYEKRYASSYMESLPDFVALAESYGHVGIQVTKPADVRQALEDAFGKYKDRTVFIDFLTEREENVYPMIPAGAGLNEMILI
ncbi:MAG TPA: biosynthetic-type acetolactate synthase large subunit [Gammaproteobacteria bacterium]|nr:biosynthetic-type acetolactate synthase large subunit [Gammaproteobacteria bacterium]